MRKDPLFFIALIPPEDLQREVTDFKQFIADNWGARHALKSPPHITLHPPFAWPESDLAQLKNCLSKFASEQTPFIVNLKNFGSFPPRVIFIKPLKNKNLEQIFQTLLTQLKANLGFSDPRKKQPFHPHVTIAHRDLTEQDFPKVWDYFKEKNFEKQFEANTLTLLRNVRGKWETETNFPFQ
jgi:2'-5' RNA ligase